MGQQSPPPVKKGVVVLQWFGVLLFLCSFGLGIFSTRTSPDESSHPLAHGFEEWMGGVTSIH